MVVGYARLPTVEQNRARQIEAVLAAGRVTGRRPGLGPFDAWERTVQQIAGLVAVPGPTEYGYLNRVTAGTPA
jgi:hypothetical protein